MDGFTEDGRRRNRIAGEYESPVNRFTEDDGIESPVNIFTEDGWNRIAGE